MTLNCMQSMPQWFQIFQTWKRKCNKVSDYVYCSRRYQQLPVDVRMFGVVNTINVTETKLMTVYHHRSI